MMVNHQQSTITVTVIAVLVSNTRLDRNTIYHQQQQQQQQ